MSETVPSLKRWRNFARWLSCLPEKIWVNSVAAKAARLIWRHFSVSVQGHNRVLSFECRPNLLTLPTLWIGTHDRVPGSLQSISVAMDTLAFSSCSEWVSECVDVFVSQICRPKGGRCCTNQVASEMRSNWNAVVSELRNSKCHGACSVQNLLSLHLPPFPKGKPADCSMLQNIIIILRLVLCECANWVLTLGEAYIWTWIYCILECDTVLPGRHAHGLEKPSSSMTRVDTRGEVSGGWKNLRNEELHYLSLSRNANKMKSSRVRCTGGILSTGELTYACAFLIAPPRPRHMCAGYVWLMIRTSGARYSNDNDQLSDYHLLKISCSPCR
jgi:hypothetical protein